MGSRLTSFFTRRKPVAKSTFSMDAIPDTQVMFNRLRADAAASSLTPQPAGEPAPDPVEKQLEGAPGEAKETAA